MQSRFLCYTALNGRFSAAGRMTGKRGIWPVNVRRIWTGTAALLLLLTAAACAPRPAQLEVLTIGTADSGGTMYPVGRAIAGAMASETRKLNIGASTGSEKNIADLSSGEIDLGLVTADAAYDAMQAGTAEGLRAIGAVYVSVSTWLAPADSGLMYVHDMTTERLGVGPENSVTEQTAQVSLEVLETDGVSPSLENCSLEQGWRELAEGKLDAVHGFVGTPAEGLVNLSQQLPCNVLRYTQEELEQILGFEPYGGGIVIGVYTNQARALQKGFVQPEGHLVFPVIEQAQGRYRAGDMLVSR